MSKSNVSTPRRKPAKPYEAKPYEAKPYEGFPLFAHPSGQWAKKIKPGPLAKPKLFYFGVWADPEAALARLNREWPSLKEGKTPPAIDRSAAPTTQLRPKARRQRLLTRAPRALAASSKAHRDDHRDRKRNRSPATPPRRARCQAA